MIVKRGHHNNFDSRLPDFYHLDPFIPGQSRHLYIQENDLGLKIMNISHRLFTAICNVYLIWPGFQNSFGARTKFLIIVGNKDFNLFSFSIDHALHP